MWVMCACRPLRRDELLCAIRLNPENKHLDPLRESISESQILHLCNNFLVLDSQRKLWRFAHLSVAEYFEKGRMNLLRSHAFVAKICLKLLMGSWSSSLAKRSYDEMSDTDCGNSISKLLHYSKYFWISHVQTQEGHDVDYQLAGLLKHFLGSFKESSIHYRRWHDQLSQTSNLAWHSPSISIFGSCHKNFVELSQISPGETTIVAVCRFSIHSLLEDWWTNAEIPLQTDINRDNPLIAATMADSKLILEILVSRGMLVNTRNCKHGSALALATHQNNLELVNFLVQKGADINMSFPSNRRHRDYTCAFAAAIGNGNLEVVEFLVQEGAGVNMDMCYAEYDSALATAIYIGKQKKNPGIVKFLIRMGARMNSQRKDENALTEAMSIGFDDIINFLICEDGADMMTSNDYMHAFKRAMRYNMFKTIISLIHRGKVDVNTVYHGSTALMRASFFEDNEAVKSLIKECHADPNVPLDFLGCGSVLSMATHKRRIALAKFLVQEGQVDVNMFLEFGDFGNALTAAVTRRNNSEIIHFLVQECKADVNVRLETGRYGSALTAAAYWGFKRNVEALVDYGADVNLGLSIGSYSTALQAARADMSEEDISHAWWDKRGDEERKQGKAKVVEVLIRHGAIDC